MNEIADKVALLYSPHQEELLNHYTAPKIWIHTPCGDFGSKSVLNFFLLIGKFCQNNSPTGLSG
jgi:hypothetical protein